MPLALILISGGEWERENGSGYTQAAAIACFVAETGVIYLLLVPDKVTGKEIY